MFKLENMEPANIEGLHLDKDGNFNPFTIDMFSSGRPFSKDVYLMFRSAGEEELSEGYFINTKTGERQRIVLNNEVEASPKHEKRI